MPRWRIPALLVLCAVLGGCATRQVITPVYTKKGTEVELRGQMRGGEPVDRGYAQPAAISPQRLTSILVAVEVRGDTGEKEDRQSLRGIVTADTLRRIVTGMSEAFAEADSSQQVVVRSLRRTRRFGVFSRQFYTAFTSYMEGDYLYIHVSHLEREVDTQKKDKLPQPWPGEASDEFRVVPTKNMHAVGPYALAVRWRDPEFAKLAPSLAKEGVRTRTILLESPVPQEEIGAALPSELSDQLSPETLRALADLEEQRRMGLITEDAYRFRRDALLRGTGHR